MILRTIANISFRKRINRAVYEKFKDGTVKDVSDELPFEIPDGW